MGDVAVEPAFSVRAEHSEGPIWDEAGARLWWVDITAERVHVTDPATGQDRSWPTPGQPGGVVLDAEGTPVVAAPDGLAPLDTTTGVATVRTPVEADRPENRLNDLKVDTRGRVWVGSMAYDKRPDAAALHLVRPDGTSTTVVEGLTISNGPALDERHGRLYLADTARFRIDVFDLDAAAGTISGRRPFLDVGDEQVWPDGMTVDDEGGLWTALGRSSQVRRLDPDGTVDAVIDLPVTNPTSVCFGGADGGDLFVTTSWFDVPAEERAGQPLAGSVLRARPGVTGRPSPRLAAST